MDSYGHLLHIRGSGAEALPILQALSDRRIRVPIRWQQSYLTRPYREGDWVRAHALMSPCIQRHGAGFTKSFANTNIYSAEQRWQAATVLARISVVLASRTRHRSKVSDQSTAGPAKTTKQVAVPNHRLRSLSNLVSVRNSRNRNGEDGSCEQFPFPQSPL
jgi:hypothetical protein